MDSAPMLSWLRQQNLRPTSYFLDVGCGRLRSTIDVVGYLEPDRYFGLDLYESMFVYNGTHPTVHMKVKQAGLEDRRPRFWQTDDFDCIPLGDVRFDFALAQSVFSHVLPPKVARCLAQLRPHMHAGSVFYASYFRSASGQVEVGRPHKGRPAPQAGAEEYDVVRYPDQTLVDLAEAAGFRFEAAGDYGHPNAQVMGAYRLAG